MDFRKDFTVEHVIPMYKGGTNRPENEAALCQTCNKAKSDHIIRPMSYYKYMSKERLAQLETLFNQYLEQTDWLAYDNLFMTDRENVMVDIEQTVRSGFVAKIPTTIQIQKISQQEAFEYIQFYTARLATDDKTLMASEPSMLKSPYYRITNGSTLYMILTAYASPINYTATDDNVQTTLHGVRIELFTNPDLIDKPKLTPRLLYAGLSAVMTRIQDTLARGYQKKSLVQCLIEYPPSDPYADTMFQYISNCYPNQFIENKVYDSKNRLQPIRAQVTWFYQGKPVKSLSQIDKRLTGTNEEIKEALLELQNPFKQRLEDSKEIHQNDHPGQKRPKKKDNPKQWHHPKRQRRKRK